MKKSHRLWMAVTLLLVLSLTLTLSSCRETSNVGDLTLDFSTDKSILPTSVAVTWVQISGTRNDDNTITFTPQNFQLGSTIGINGLSVGTWTFNVVGYGVDPASVGAFPLTSPATNASVVIQSGKKTTATFTLRYLTTGTGSADVTVTWPNNANVAVKGTLSNGTEVSSPLSTTGTTKLSYTGVPTGDYGFDLTLTNPSGTTIPFAMIDMVNIFSGLKSEGTVALVSEDFPVLASPAMTASEESSKGDPVYAYRTVTLTAPSGATLYYTTDGTTPSFSAIGILGGTTKEYLAPFDITATGETTIQALSAKAGYLDSAVSNQAFTIIGLGEGGVTIDKPALVSNVIITQADPELAKFTVSYEAEGNPTVTATWYRDSETTAATDTDGDGNQLTFTPTLAEGGRHQVRVNLAYSDGTQAKTASASLRFTAPQVATPVISNTDTTGGQQVTISSATSDSTIYYTTDGSDPTTSVTKVPYTDPFNINTTKTVKVVALKSGMVNSAIETKNVTVSQVATPTISPVGGLFSISQQVTMSCATSFAEIHYTTDGSTPTASSAIYTGAITLNSTATVKAIAIKSGMVDSLSSSQSYTLMGTVATPVISPSATTFSGTITVTISSTSSATIKYTTDGSTPSGACPSYTGGFTINTSTTVKAIAYKSGMVDSAMASKNYTLMETAITPTITNSNVTGGQQVTIASATSGAAIYYTLDGSVPTTSSSPYNSSFKLTATKTVKALAIKAGMTNSAVATKSVTVSQVVTPTFNPSSKTFSNSQTVIMNSTSGSTIYYTTDGSTPTTSSSSITSGGSITVSSTTTIKAMAMKSGMINSGVSSATFTREYAIGDTGPAGGIVFYVDTNDTYSGWKYLEAATADEPEPYMWGGSGALIGTGTGIGMGEANTDIIVKGYGNFNDTPYAAKKCADKTVTNNDVTYADWFLPSKEELNLMYEAKSAIGGFSTDDVYWSSSEASENPAWYQSFSTGSPSSYYKHFTHYVRAIRSFE